MGIAVEYQLIQISSNHIRMSSMDRVIYNKLIMYIESHP